MLRSYYEAEIRYLQEAGRVFAQTYPDEAAHLNLDSLSDRDPFVERLFEGFAFLTGRIHQRLDDDLPQVTEGLLQLLCPHFLKPVPSCCILALDPIPGLVQEHTRLPPGLEVRSAPVGPEQTTVRFQTAAPVDIYPVRLAEVDLQGAGTRRSRVRLGFQLDRGARLGRLPLQRLRLCIHAEMPLAATIHLYLTRHLAGLSLRTGSHRVDLTGQKWITPAGLQPTDRLLPAEPASFSGFQLLQEYFCVRRRFWFVDLYGLDHLGAGAPSHARSSGGPAPGETRKFDVWLTFNRPYPPDSSFDATHLRLYCTPAVNLFEMDAEPIRVDGRYAEHRIVPDVHSPKSLLAYDVQSVAGVEEDTGRRHEYTPFYRLDRAPWPAPGLDEASAGTASPASPRHYTVFRRDGPRDSPDLTLSLNGSDLPTTARSSSQSLSLRIRATNGTLPRRALGTDALTTLASGLPQIVQPTNLTRPTPLYRPPDRSQFHWALLSHLAFNLQSATTAHALTGLLRLYDWTSARKRTANQRRIDGLDTVSWSPTSIISHGAALRGLAVSIDVDETAFAGEGDLCLFGAVMSTFLSAYATINTCVELTLRARPSGRQYTWPASPGTRPLL
jgi:type VI secretion system protein ImpG